MQSGSMAGYLEGAERGDNERCDDSGPRFVITVFQDQPNGIIEIGFGDDDLEDAGGFKLDSLPGLTELLKNVLRNYCKALSDEYHRCNDGY